MRTYLWRKEGKEIDLTLPGMHDLVAERAAVRHGRRGRDTLPRRRIPLPWTRRRKRPIHCDSSK